jgi:hypothetical protein
LLFFCLPPVTTLNQSTFTSPSVVNNIVFLFSIFDVSTDKEAKDEEAKDEEDKDEEAKDESDKDEEAKEVFIHSGKEVSPKPSSCSILNHMVMINFMATSHLMPFHASPCFALLFHVALAFSGSKLTMKEQQRKNNNERTTTK